MQRDQGLPDLRETLPALIGRALGADEPVAIAVSGGPDSLALLTLAVEAFPGRVTALTVDHRLRPGSEAEAADVARQCAVRGIAHQTLVRAGPRPRSNLQATARAARYRLLGDWCEAEGHRLLLTAHHADDQAETLLMRLGRGSGLAGLAGIRPVKPLTRNVVLARPLLGHRRAMLAGLAASAGWHPIDDPSNRDPRHDRSRMRARLAETDWLDPAALSASAGHLAAAEAAFQWLIAEAWRGRAVIEEGRIILDSVGLPPELVRRLLHKSLETLAPSARLRGSEVDRWAGALAKGQTATLAGVQGKPGPVLTLRRLPARSLHGRSGQIRTG